MWKIRKSDINQILFGQSENHVCGKSENQILFGQSENQIVFVQSDIFRVIRKSDNQKNRVPELQRINLCCMEKSQKE